MNEITPERVRDFLLAKYATPIAALGFESGTVPDDFDFLLTGVVDSFGILEMVSAIEEELNVELDLGALDAEQMTILGPLSRYVAENSRGK